ncbi:DUF11 domain-containing protein [Solitalea lacus]|uniref:DUF11 domain-containing protein n=1 Tax=Solitalea lacus TaxID=2911172 RepID=UPI001EDC4382|nr:DUF11 domain-containing protein [Solitalea lacus]UKJ06470.1 DUF11 domain-containing protein [Solitalea lacus]
MNDRSHRSSLRSIYYQRQRWIISFFIFFISILFLASFAFAKEIKLTGINNADLSITNSVDRITVKEGEIFTYQIRLENVGPSTAKLIRVKDVLPINFEYYSSSVSSVVYDPITRQLSYNLDQLKAGDFQIILIKVRANKIGIASNTAVITAQTTDPTLSNNVSTADDVIISVRPRKVNNNAIMESDSEEPVLVNSTSALKNRIRERFASNLLIAWIEGDLFPQIQNWHIPCICNNQKQFKLQKGRSYPF